MKKNKHTHKKQTKSVVGVEKKKNKFIRTLVFTILLIGLFSSSMYGVKCFITKVCDSIMIDKFVRHDVTILMPKGALSVEVADTQASRELGLSGREKMGDDEGILFVFDTPGRYGFWMKDMQFPLDIIWINQNGVVVNMKEKKFSVSN